MGRMTRTLAFGMLALPAVAVLTMAILAMAAWTPAAAQSKQASPAEVAAIQVQILETTRKSAEAALEQNKVAMEQTRKTADTAIAQSGAALAQVTKLAEQTMQSARESNDQVYKWASGVLLFLTAATTGLGIFGFREFKTLRQSVEARMDETLVAAVRAAVDNAVSQARKQSEIAAHLSVDMNNFTALFQPVNEGKDKEKIRSLAPTLVSSAEIIKRNARELGDTRTLGWILTNLALLHYHLGEYGRALELQQESCLYIVPHTAADRRRNLACIASKYYEVSKLQYALECSVQTLRDMLDGKLVNDTAAREMLADSDLNCAFAASPNLRSELEKIASLPAPPPQARGEEGAR